MDVVRLFYNNIDIKPAVVVQHFLHYLGFYVEQNGGSRSYVREESILDIYLISNSFFSVDENILDDIDLQKTILILKDEWRSGDDGIRAIYWNENVSNEDFLSDFVKAIYRKIEQSGKARLLRSDINWLNSAINVIKKYTEYKLLEASLVTRCFYKQNEFYNWGIENYKKFIGVISNSGTSDYIKYVTLFAKYEANLISKKNSYKYYYDTKNLLNECNELLNKYNENEELHLLKADILFELQDEWMIGCDRYGDREVSHCAYAFLKRGKIVKMYYREYENAIYLLKKSVTLFPQYYQAWYQLGDSYEAIDDVESAINAFKKVYKILENKFRKHILAPVEWEYIYKAVMRIAIIYKIRLGDYASAYEYNDIANAIRGENAIDYYIKQMLGEGLDIEDIAYKIYEAIKEYVDIKLEEIY